MLEGFNLPVFFVKTLFWNSFNRLTYAAIVCFEADISLFKPDEKERFFCVAPINLILPNL